jgi:hypothetical protein
MSKNVQKITIEKRVFKLENNEDFILEYPSNYKELVDKKLNKLQEEYDEVNNVNKENENNENINNNINKENLSDNSKNSNEKNDNINHYNIDNENKEYYHRLGEVPDCLNDDDDGFIEVKEENNEDNKIENNNINLKEYENLNQDNEKKEININDFEFTEDIKIEEKKIEQKKRKNSPIKNPEKIKEAMKSLNIKPPEWAKNLTDEDFMFRVKTYLKNKKNK